MSSGRIANAVAFQIGWFACVLGAAWGYWWAGPLFVAAFALLQLGLLEDRRRESRLILVTLLIGWVFDSVLILFGYYIPKANVFEGWGSSPWLVAMWVNFALTLRHSMSWMRGRYGVGAVMGAIFGPMAYHAGVRLGAMSIPDGPMAMTLLLAAGWAAAIPFLLWFAWRDEV